WAQSPAVAACRRRRRPSATRAIAAAAVLPRCVPRRSQPIADRRFIGHRSAPLDGISSAARRARPILPGVTGETAPRRPLRARLFDLAALDRSLEIPTLKAEEISMPAFISRSCPMNTNTPQPGDACPETDLRDALDKAGWRFTRQRSAVFDFLRS